MPQPAANDAGPSRPRRDSAPSASTSKSSGASSAAQDLSRDNSASGTSSATPTQRRPASPKSAMSRSASPGKDKDGREAATPHLDSASYPTPKLLKSSAGSSQQIASANDASRAEQEEEPEDEEGSTTTDSRSRSSITHPSPTTALFHDDPPPDLANGDPLFTASKVSLSHPSSILSFHARHVPSISIEAYLLRILKYCPTTNEVFLGLLVYFDRMSRLGTTAGVGGTSAAVGPRGFSIDSYNIHRLIIAGVTVASKFFSDVFYTNSRYAKVGGSPPHELNQLESQFSSSNNFTLMIPPEEMQSYGDRLLAYWQGREEAAPAPGTSQTPGGGRGAAPASTSTPQEEVARSRAKERQEREYREREKERERERERSRDRAREEGREKERKERAEREDRERAEREKEQPRSERQASSAPMDVDEHNYPAQNGIERAGPSPAPAGVVGSRA